MGEKTRQTPALPIKGRIALTSAPTSNTSQTTEEDKEPELKELAHCMHSLNDLGKEQLFDLIMD